MASLLQMGSPLIYRNSLVKRIQRPRSFTCTIVAKTTRADESPVVLRRSANYQPSLWDHHHLLSVENKYTVRQGMINRVFQPRFLTHDVTFFLESKSIDKCQTLINQRLRRPVESLEHHLLYVPITSFITCKRPLPSSAEINTTGIPVICDQKIMFLIAQEPEI